jgi:hypothetical protein
MKSHPALTAAPKKLTSTAVLGERGINLIESVALEMHCAWHPTNTALDVGLDGWIELADPGTEAALGLIIFVQSRATAGRFQNETDESFEYLCKERDLNYWLNVNGPVILVRSRPHQREAYWIDIKKYFSTPERRQARLIVFDKQRDRFDAGVREALLRISVPATRGLSAPPIPLSETLYSNLLPVKDLPARLYEGTTTAKDRNEIRDRLIRAGNTRREWAARGDRLLSVHDLTTPEWSSVVDRGTVEDFPTDEWACSEDKERVDLFVELLKKCLSSRLWGRRVRWDANSERYFFEANRNLSPRTVPYRSLKRQSHRTVVDAYEYKEPEREGIAYHRHYALRVQWLRLDNRWYLALSPTYRFTSDGEREHPFAQNKLKGIKALENNAAVLAHVVFWADMLRDRESDLFEQPTYPYLTFEGLLTFPFEVGVNDALWAASDDDSIPTVDDTADLLDLGLDISSAAGEGPDTAVVTAELLASANGHKTNGRAPKRGRRGRRRRSE